MGLGDVLLVTDTGSPARLNAKTTIWTDALTLSNLPTTPCMRVIPTTTGYSFTKDVPRRRNADNNAWLNDGMTKHRHVDETDLDGGALSEIMFANMGNVIDVNQVDLKVSQLITFVSGAGASATDEINQTTTSRTIFNAGTASGGYAQFMTKGVRPHFGSRSKYQVGFEIDLATSMLFRLGIGSEGVEIANDARRKYGVEGCSAAPEGTVMLIFSADNVTRTTQASVNNIVESGGESYVLQHSPSLNIKMIKGALVNVTNKSNNIPSAGSITGLSGDNFGVIKGGIKTTTASQTKKLQMWAQRFVAYADESRWDHVLWQD